MQVELDNTAADFRRLHTERQDLVRQWQNAIDGMRRRDDEINAVGEKYAAARQVRASRIETLAQNAARLKMQKNDNKEVMKEWLFRIRQKTQCAPPLSLFVGQLSTLLNGPENTKKEAARAEQPGFSSAFTKLFDKQGPNTWLPLLRAWRFDHLGGVSIPYPQKFSRLARAC